MKTPLQIAIAGMGGYAGEHHKALRVLEAEGTARLVATCDPKPEHFAAEQEQWEFRARGVRVYSHFGEMLDARGDALDCVALPTPLPLHAPMHHACVARGLACYLEKPPTLFWGELDAMLEVERRARHATQVGFNFIAEKPRQDLKRRLVAGEFGILRRVGFAGNWPRPASYFTRATWAGRLMQGERLVLDSCTGNAMAHFLHNLLFWCGQGELFSWGEVEEIEAELYRAHPIESFDTAFVRGRCGEVEVRITTSHAGDSPSFHCEWLDCDRATLIYRTGNDYEVRWHDGRVESGATQTGTLLVENLRHYARYLTGEAARPLTQLHEARPFVHLHNLLFVAAGNIASVAETHLRHTTGKDGRVLTAIEGAGALMDVFTRTGAFPSEAGASWGRAGGRTPRKDLSRLETVVRAMKSQFDEDAQHALLHLRPLTSPSTPAPLLTAKT